MQCRDVETVVIPGVVEAPPVRIGRGMREEVLPVGWDPVTERIDHRQYPERLLVGQVRCYSVPYPEK